jgi:hypothetical protein
VLRLKSPAGVTAVTPPELAAFAPGDPKRGPKYPN